MPNNRTKGNDTLRKHLASFLKKINPETIIYTNHLIAEFSKRNKNYSLSSARITNLLKEHDHLVVFIKSGVWMKL